MGLYRLNYTNSDLSDGFLEKANKKHIDYEKDFENWLENSPHILFEDETSTIMWIGRQVSAATNELVKYPDLLGIDMNGNVIIAELKKGKTPRDVVAQLLEYAAWAEKLTYEELNTIAMKYYDKKSQYQGLELSEIHRLIFNPENDTEYNVKFNLKLRLYVIAEEISHSVKDVIKFLNRIGNIDISYIRYEVFKAGDKEFYISTEVDEADLPDKLSSSKLQSSSKWNGEILIKDIVKNAVDKLLSSKNENVFTAQEVFSEVLKIYENCNINSLRCQLYSDCVNHTSRKHYKSGQMDYYYCIEKNKYRYYDSKTDGKWNSDGIRIE